LVLFCSFRDPIFFEDVGLSSSAYLSSLHSACRKEKKDHEGGILGARPGSSVQQFCPQSLNHTEDWEVQSSVCAGKEKMEFGECSSHFLDDF
jgi:hypothetical protein